MTQPRILEVRTQILKKNDELARALRQRFKIAGCFVVSLVSSPGTGKTLFLRETIARLAAKHRVAALVGDLRTDHDARRGSHRAAAGRRRRGAWWFGRRG